MAAKCRQSASATIDSAIELVSKDKLADDFHFTERKRTRTALDRFGKQASQNVGHSLLAASGSSHDGHVHVLPSDHLTRTARLDTRARLETAADSMLHGHSALYVHDTLQHIQ